MTAFVFSAQGYVGDAFGPFGCVGVSKASRGTAACVPAVASAPSDRIEEAYAEICEGNRTRRHICRVYSPPDRRQPSAAPIAKTSLKLGKDTKITTTIAAAAATSGAEAGVRPSGHGQLRHDHSG